MKKTCPYCLQQFKALSYHVKTCDKNPGDPNPWLTAILFNYPLAKDKDKILSLYLVEKFSLPMLQKYLGGLDYKNIQKLLRYYGVEKFRSTSEALLDPQTRARIEASNIQLFGARNTFCKNAPGYLATKRTVKARYNVDNVFQILDQFVEPTSTGKISSLNRRIQTILDNYGLSYTPEFQLYGIIDGQLRYRYYDFEIWDTGLLIEVNGDYWHANPEIYGNYGTIVYNGHEERIEDIHERDFQKRALAWSHDYRVLTLWESEMKNCTDSQLYYQIITACHE